MIELTAPIFEWVFPRRCVLCDQTALKHHLCAACLSLGCVNGNEPILIDKNKSALFFYEFTIKQMLLTAKFYHSMTHAQLLLDLALEQLYRSKIIHALKSFSPSVITYVPMHWRNRLIRGVDIPRLFARSIARELGIAYRSCLRCNSAKDRQVLRANKTDRQRGVAGKFSLCISNQHYDRILIVDDIITTGATFNESTKMLRQIGNETKCLAIARTP